MEKPSSRLDHKAIISAEKSAQKLPESSYICADISDELWREVITERMTVHIDNPVTLIIRKGGSTHRVVTEDGTVYCYAAPETGKSVLKWKAREGCPPVQY